MLFLFVPQVDFVAADEIVNDSTGQTNGAINSVFGVEGTQFIFVNSTSATLYDVKTKSEIDSVPCTTFSRMDQDSTKLMCEDGIYEVNQTGFNLLHQGPIDRLATPNNNLTAVVTGNELLRVKSMSTWFGRVINYLQWKYTNEANFTFITNIIPVLKILPLIRCHS